MTSPSKTAHEFVEAIRAGKVCLHPTDTIPGIGCDPFNAGAVCSLNEIKGRSETAGTLSLVSSLELAKQFWQPLPFPWDEVLSKVWPAPLSVLWKASAVAPKGACSTDGYLGLRVPAIGEAPWFLEALALLGKPMTTTSVNRHGEAPANDWQAAKKFLNHHAEAHIPNVDMPSHVKSAVPSTIVKILQSGGVEIVRKGAFSEELLRKHLAKG